MYYPKESQLFREQIDYLMDHKIKVAVIGHLRPDGDCIGSTVGLVRLLMSQGIEVIGVNNDETPENLKAFIGDTPFVKASDFEADGHRAITVDCADYKRVGGLLNEVFPNVYLNIDHHISNKNYAENNSVIGTASATAEILAGFALDLGLPIDPTTAQALYVGIATDTGQFRFSSTTQETFQMAQSLCESGASPSAAANELYEHESFARIQLIQAFLASLEMELEGRVCFGYLSDSVYSDAGATIDDAEGLVDYARSIKGVDVGVLLEEREGALKGSLRAKDPKFRVDQIAQVFGGGGHACAAGLNVQAMTIDEFKPKILAKIQEHLLSIN